MRGRCQLNRPASLVIGRFASLLLASSLPLGLLTALFCRFPVRFFGLLGALLGLFGRLLRLGGGFSGAAGLSRARRFARTRAARRASGRLTAALAFALGPGQAGIANV